MEVIPGFVDVSWPSIKNQVIEGLKVPIVTRVQLKRDDTRIIGLSEKDTPWKTGLQPNVVVE